MINLIGSILNGSQPTDREWVFGKASLFGVTDSKVREKVAFAFFLDKANQKNTALFPDLQFCSGSLSEDLFANTIGQLLEMNSPLSGLTLQVIKDYLYAIKETESFNFFVDEARSQNLFLILLAKTGSSFLKDNYWTSFSKSSSEIVQLIKRIDQEVQSLKTGEKRLFLFGSLIHDTRLYVERREPGKFLFAYFDPAHPTTLEYSYWIDRDKAIGDAFWRPICEKKFERQAIQGTSNDIPKHFMAHGKSEKNPETALLKTQKQNSCHFRSILGPLKWQLYLACTQNKIDFEIEWKTFKATFGAVLLAGLSTNPPLQELSRKKVLVLQKKSELQVKIQEAKNDKPLEIATVKELKKILSHFVFLGRDTDIDLRQQNPDDDLELLAKKCRLMCKLSAITLEPFSAFFLNTPVSKAIFDLYVTEANEKTALLTNEKTALLTKESFKDKSLFLPAAKTLFKNSAEEKWHGRLTRYLECLNKQPETPYRRLFYIALDEILGSKDAFLNFPEEPNDLLSDSAWVSIARTYSQASNYDMQRLAARMATILFFKKHHENPNLHWGKEIELLTAGFDDYPRSQAAMMLWISGYEKGLFPQISSLNVKQPNSGPIFLGFFPSPLNLNNYLNIELLLKEQDLPHELVARCFRDLSELAFQERKASLFFDLFGPLCEKFGSLRAGGYVPNDSFDVLGFLLEEAFKASLEPKIIAALLLKIIEKESIEFQKENSFLETIDPVVKSAIEERFYGADVSLQRFKLLGDNKCRLPEGSWTKQFLTMIDSLLDITESSLEVWAETATFFNALPKEVKSDLIQALYAEASNKKKLFDQLQKLKISSE